jgi:hypothetical protein
MYREIKNSKSLKKKKKTPPSCTSGFFSFFFWGGHYCDDVAKVANDPQGDLARFGC